MWPLNRNVWRSLLYHFQCPWAYVSLIDLGCQVWGWTEVMVPPFEALSGCLLNLEATTMRPSLQHLPGSDVSRAESSFLNPLHCCFELPELTTAHSHHCTQSRPISAQCWLCSPSAVNKGKCLDFSPLHSLQIKTLHK